MLSPEVAAPKQLPLEYAIAKEETMKKQHMLPFCVNNLRMAANCLTKLRGETKILYEILETFFCQIKVCTVSGRREKAGAGLPFAESAILRRV